MSLALSSTALPSTVGVCSCAGCCCAALEGKGKKKRTAASAASGARCARHLFVSGVPSIIVSAAGPKLGRRAVAELRRGADQSRSNPVIRMAGEDGRRSIDLFGQHDARQLMRPGHRAEGEQEV